MRGALASLESQVELLGALIAAIDSRLFGEAPKAIEPQRDTSIRPVDHALSSVANELAQIAKTAESIRDRL